jgi:gamma-glutamylcyclotransferase (GGCT)/AIG2-like uncharacterized protein YtfP
MQKVFVYETLKNKMRVELLLDRMPDYVLDKIVGYKEVYKGEYPTLVPSNKDETRGITLFVTASEMTTLDNWEEKYTRKQFKAGAGTVWVYILK